MAEPVWTLQTQSRWGFSTAAPLQEWAIHKPNLQSTTGNAQAIIPPAFWGDIKTNMQLCSAQSKDWFTLSKSLTSLSHLGQTNTFLFRKSWFMTEIPNSQSGIMKSKNQKETAGTASHSPAECAGLEKHV